MQIQVKKLNEIKPYARNPRKNAGAVEAVAESIKEFGFKNPIILDADGEIIAGHTRFLAAKDLKIEEVPCIYADDLTPEQVKAFRLADNKTAELADWDFNLLDEELQDIADIDMSLFGFDVDLEEPAEDKEIEEVEFETNPDPVTHPGDVWQLGAHRLMCGDSTSVSDLAKLTEGKPLDMCFADPPYGMKKEKDGVANDNLNYDDLLEFNKKWIPKALATLTDVGSWYCWGTDEPLMDIYGEILKPAAKRNEITFRNLITWDKGSGQGQNSADRRGYATADEKCLFIMKGVQGFNNNQENYFEGWEPIRKYLADEAERVGLTSKGLKEICGVGMYSHWFTKSQWVFIPEKHYKTLQKTFAEVNGFAKDYKELQYGCDEIKRGTKYEDHKAGFDEIKKGFYDSRAYFNNTHDNMNNVWHFSRLMHGTAELKEAGGHATPKPIALCARAIKSSAPEGGTVLDPFGGSGSSLMACEQTGRIAYMMELEPRWCDVIIERWENFTGQKAQLIERSDDQ